MGPETRPKICFVVKHCRRSGGKTLGFPFKSMLPFQGRHSFIFGAALPTPQKNTTLLRAPGKMTQSELMGNSLIL